MSTCPQFGVKNHTIKKKEKKGGVTGNPADLDLKPGNVSFLNPFLTPLRWQMWKEKNPEWFSTQRLRMIYDTHHVNTNVLFIFQLDFFTLFSCRSLKIQLTESISHPSRLTGSAVIGKRVPKCQVWFLSKEKLQTETSRQVWQRWLHVKIYFHEERTSAQELHQQRFMHRLWLWK